MLWPIYGRGAFYTLIHLLEMLDSRLAKLRFHLDYFGRTQGPQQDSMHGRSRPISDHRVEAALRQNLDPSLRVRRNERTDLDIGVARFWMHQVARCLGFRGNRWHLDRSVLNDCDNQRRGLPLRFPCGHTCWFTKFG